MKNSKKIMTFEQKISVVEFIAKWLKSNKKIEISISSSYIINNGKVGYLINMDIFDKEHINSIIVMNYVMDISISVDKENLPTQCRNNIEIIESKISDIMLLNEKEQDLTDKEFNMITNLEPDLMMARSKKINYIKEHLK